MIQITRFRWSKFPGFGEIFTLNKILYTLILSDFILISAYGLVAPIFAVFLTDRILGATLVTVGIAEAVYLATKSILQVPLGILIDRTEGQKIDFWFLFLGNLMMAVAIFTYLPATLPWHIYLISFFYGIGAALAFPAWTGMFTRNIVTNRESFAWSLSTTVVEVGEAFAAVIGGVIAEFLGFETLFIVVGAISVIGALSLFFAYGDING
jgi:MFS family permease